ncbi:hypothetical protein DKX15_18195, partial [Enterococcus faecium]
GVAGDRQRRDAVLLDRRPHVVGVELGEQDDRRAAEQPAERAPLCGAVQQRCQHERVRRPGGEAVARQLVLVFDALAGDEVDAAAQRA